MTSQISGLGQRVSNPSTLVTNLNEGRRAGEKLAGAVEEASSGVVAVSYGDPKIAQNTRTILDAEQRIENAERNLARILSVEQRVNRAVQANDTLIKIAQDVRDRAMKATDPTATDVGFSQFCTDKLAQVQSQLNARDAEGRNLFGGIQTEGAIVDLSLFPVPASGSIPAFTNYQYYSGTDSLQSTTLRNSEPLEYGFNARDDAVYSLIHYLKLGQATNPDRDANSPNTQNLQRMIEGLGDTNKALSQVKERLGGQLGRIETTKSDNEDDEVFYDGVKAEILDADVIRAIMDQITAAAQLEVITKSQQKTTETLADLLRLI